MLIVGTSSALQAALVVATNASPPTASVPIEKEGASWHVSARLRYEDRKNFLFGGAGAANDDNFYLPQVRFGLTFPVGTALAFLEGQSAHALGSEAINTNATPNAFEDRFDLHQAYIESNGVRIGRQKLNYGTQRLVGAFEWSNTARTFDAVRI